MEHLHIFSLLYILKSYNVQRTSHLNMSKNSTTQTVAFYSLSKCLDYFPGPRKLIKVFLTRDVYRFQCQLCFRNHITDFINISHDSHLALHVFALNRECYQIVKQISSALEKSQIVAVCTRWEHRNLNVKERSQLNGYLPLCC